MDGWPSTLYRLRIADNGVQGLLLRDRLRFLGAVGSQLVEEKGGLLGAPHPTAPSLLLVYLQG